LGRGSEIAYNPRDEISNRRRRAKIKSKFGEEDRCARCGAGKLSY